MRVVTILSVALVALAGVRTAAACSCALPPEPREALAHASAVFAGTVTAIEQQGEDAAGHYVVRLRVDRHLKGPQAAELTIRTAESSAACGYYFREGKQYLVYADEYEGALHVSLCSRTARLADAAEDLRALGIEDLEVEADEGGDLVGATGGRRCGGRDNTAALQAVVFVLAGVVATRRRRRRQV